jgi:hypothetical protein
MASNHRTLRRCSAQGGYELQICSWWPGQDPMRRTCSPHPGQDTKSMHLTVGRARLERLGETILTCACSGPRPPIQSMKFQSTDANDTFGIQIQDEQRVQTKLGFSELLTPLLSARAYLIPTDHHQLRDRALRVSGAVHRSGMNSICCNRM